MATGISTAIVAGNLTRDAELNDSGRVLSFAVAVNRREKDGDDWAERASFFDCKVLGNRAQPLKGILTKGTKVTILGDLVQERWEKDGEKRSAIRILAREVVLGSGSQGDGSQGDRSRSSDEADDSQGW